MKYLRILLLLVFPIASYGQGHVSTDYLSSSNFKDDNGNKYGSGSLMILSGRYTLPLSTKQNNAGQITAWTATLNCRYGILNNEAEAKKLNPDNILNSSINISHIRPITEKWSVLASLGCGVYAAPNDVTLKSVLANGAVVFVYKLRDNLSVGVGAGLTNSYGIPMILPMGYLNWQSLGKYEIKVDMSSGLNISASTWLTKKIKLELTAIEIDGMSSVMDINGKSKIYSTMMMKSYASPSFHISKQTSLYLGIGGNWLRSTKISDRSLRGFFDSFKDDENKYQFGASLRLMAGVKFKF